MKKNTFLAATVILAFILMAWPRPAAAWRQGWAFAPGVYGGYPWGPTPWALSPSPRPSPDYRYAYPPGAPLSYYDPGSGAMYCFSRPTGFYFACGYSPSVGPPPPPLPYAPGVAPSVVDQAATPASGVLLFRLPEGAGVAVDGVPIGLSDGLGIIAVAPGRHRVVLQVSGTETEHTVNVAPHRIFTVTPSAIVATEP